MNEEMYCKVWERFLKLLEDYETEGRRRADYAKCEALRKQAGAEVAGGK